jgi:multiple sugar transport system permease protein
MLSKDKIKKFAPRISVELLMILISVIMLLPFCWMISTSLRLPKDSFNLPPALFPTAFHIDNYIIVFKKFPFLSFILNSFKVTILTTVIQCTITTMAAYAFARIEFKGKNILFIMLLSGLMIPVQSTIIPQFLIIKKLGLMDNHWALILPNLVYPLGIFLIRQLMMSIPRTYDEAAYIDGASRLRIFWNIIIPCSKPAIAVVAVMSFITSWNNFFGPLIYINTWEKMTLPLGLTVLQGYRGSGSISVVLAGVSMTLIPPCLVYIFGQKYLVQGTTLTGIKG